MPTKKNSNSTTSAEGAKETENIVAAPKFKQWRITTLADVNNVDDGQLDKVLYFLNHSLRKCKLTNKTLIAMNYHEQGRIVLETEDNVEQEVEAVKAEDPLA